ncbi:hypothetical protein BJX76DRAFT_367333 [Aspergillus varians]
MEDIINHEQFRQTIQAAVRQHSTQYTDSYSLSIRWEMDNTQAHRDTGHFQSLLQTFHLPAAQELVIAATDDTPGWTLQGRFRQILSSAKQNRGRALVIVHYAGHGEAQQDNGLDFVEHESGRRFSAQVFLFSMVMQNQGYELSNDSNVDVLFLLDCCHSYVACRAPETSHRIVEVIAATDESASLAYSPPRNTITAKLAGEIRRRQREGHKYVEFAEVVQSLRAQPGAVKRPSHGLRMGALSICLPFSGLTNVNPQHIQPPLRVVFGVHITDNMTAGQLNNFVTWIQALPANATITLEGVYPTSSTLLILCAPYAVYSKLAGMRGYTFMAEVKGSNMMRQPLRPVGSGSSASPNKENIPLGASHGKQGL